MFYYAWSCIHGGFGIQEGSKKCAWFWFEKLKTKKYSRALILYYILSKKPKNEFDYLDDKSDLLVTHFVRSCKKRLVTNKFFEVLTDLSIKNDEFAQFLLVRGVRHRNLKVSIFDYDVERVINHLVEIGNVTGLYDIVRLKKDNLSTRKSLIYLRQALDQGKLDDMKVLPNLLKNPHREWYHKL